jgi:hypothetical protein
VRLAPLAFLLAVSCGTTLVKQEIRRQSDGWTVTFHELRDGPNGFVAGAGTEYTPGKGERFLWVTLSVHNDLGSAREFTFDSCGLELAGESVSLPLFAILGIGAIGSNSPTLDAGEEITRKLVFGYPEKKLPEKLVCFGNEIPLVARR